MPTDTPRKKGAQPNNTNALKHGFYARSFNNLEEADLSKLENDLQGEIVMLKVATRRLFELASSEATDLEDSLKILAALGVSATRIATLARTQRLLTGEEPGLNGALNQALSEVLKEMCIK